jgi:hypothetical protein
LFAPNLQELGRNHNIIQLQEMILLPHYGERKISQDTIMFLLRGKYTNIYIIMHTEKYTRVCFLIKIKNAPNLTIINSLEYSPVTREI